ncbi:MAG: NADH-quinone oxidoreductase subunit K [Deltaproteobacteria bacterium]|nr:NADH-quinone oxidoreductase subunit K [Deltaproteobacteria bacterium]MCX7952092.1 NADH-quinone oxidoreductase subunit K [Deltaproteobacteria bacterium]
MEGKFALAVLIGCLSGVGCYLILQESVMRILLGLSILSTAVNLFIFASSQPKSLAPIGKSFSNSDLFSDPLTQALILTAIVIGFGMLSFLFGIACKTTERSRCDDTALIDLED